MIWRLTGLAFVAVLYTLTWAAEIAGAHVLLAPLLVLPMLVLLVAGGNWLQQWLGIERPSPKYTEPAVPDDHDPASSEQP